MSNLVHQQAKVSGSILQNQRRSLVILTQRHLRHLGSILVWPSDMRWVLSMVQVHAGSTNLGGSAGASAWHLLHPYLVTVPVSKPLEQPPKPLEHPDFLAGLHNGMWQSRSTTGGMFPLTENAAKEPSKEHFRTFHVWARCGIRLGWLAPTTNN